MRWCRLIDPWRLQRLALEVLSPRRVSMVAIGLSVAGMGLVTPLLRSAVAQLVQLLYKDWHETPVISGRGLARHHQMLTALPVAMALLLQASDDSAMLVGAIYKVL